MKRHRQAALEPGPIRDPDSAPGLAVAGLLMLLAIVLMSNPFFGAKEKLWPWEILVQSIASLRVKTIFAAWVLTGFWCILLSLTGPRRVRALGAVVLWAFLLIESTGGMAGFTIEVFNFNNMLGMTTLGAGLWLARGASTRSLGRLLAGAGGLLLVWAMASGFPYAESAAGGGDSQIELYLQEMSSLLRTGHVASTEPNHLWWTVLPQTVILVSAACGVLAALGLTKRLFLTIAFYLLLAGLVMPTIVGIVLLLSKHGGAQDVVEQLTMNLVGHGLLLYLLGVFALADLGSASADRVEREAA